MTRRVRFSPFACSGVFAAALALAASSAPGGDVPFTTQPPLSTTAAGVIAVFVADVDGDGDLDALSASILDDKIAWYENSAGNGTAWILRTISTLANGAFSVHAADVDGDGDLDVLSASRYDDNVAWYENTAGNGTAWTLRTISTAADFTQSVFAADVDGDGDVDALSASFNDDTLAWYENTAGNGTAWAVHTISTAADGARNVFAADVDGDGDVDALSTSAFDNTVAWYENTAGNGTTWAPHVISTTGVDPISVSAADVDGDGDMDALCAVRLDDKVAWFENTAGNGTAWALHTISTAADVPEAVLAADVDGDGDTDVLSASHDDDKVAWYENTAGNGAAWTLRTISTAANGAVAVFAADLDGDGDQDVLSASVLDNTVAWYRNDTIHGGACFVTRPPISTAADNAQSVFVADVDGDGDLDAVSASFLDDEVAWYENSGDGAAWAPHAISTAADGALSAIAADVDGDGDLDALSASATDDEIAWYENAAGNGTAWIPHTIATSADGASDVAAADVDGDGDMDVLSSSSNDHRFAWYQNTAGNGTAWTPRTIATSGFYPSSVSAADVDGDGDLDAVSTAFYFGNVAWHENTAGDGTVWATHVITTNAHGASEAQAADMDGDGDLDVLVADDFFDGQFRWYENNNGTGNSWSPHGLPGSQEATAFAADLDRDGDTDALSAFATQMEWHENITGDGTTWNVHYISFALNGPGGSFAADVDGDGDLDALTSSFGDDTIAWYQNQEGQFSLAATDTAPAGAVNGELVPMLSVVATHLGRAGDGDMELVGLGLLFEEAAGDPLTTAEANAVIESLRIYRDANGNGVFDPASDVLVANLPTLALTNGIQIVSFADGDPNVQVGFGTPPTYFVVTELTGNASSQDPNQFRVTHLGLGPSASAAEDRTYDIALRPACPADVPSSVIGPITPVELLGFVVE